MKKVAGISWTNKSVISFAGAHDPVRVVQNAARALVLRAKESGWVGPPFNPLKLAELMDVHVVANASIGDACVFITESGPRIEFNPQQPRERVRFSIAHELAHLLFPDWQEEVRNRGSVQPGDDWQLEMLCNLAASEFVLPIGSIAPGIEISSIEELMVQRRAFDVSAEAFLNRVARVAEAPIGVFFASRTDEEADSAEYRIDYFVSSPTAPQLHLSGFVVPQQSMLRACTAVGYTYRTVENWVTEQPVQIEMVGIPPYPGRIYPRVAGLVRFSGAVLGANPIQYVHGSVLEPRNSGLKVACQLVNDKAIKWGGGVARKFGRKFPDAEGAFSSEMIKLKMAERLGKVIFTRASEDLVIASLIVQEGYGPSLFPRLRYSALKEALHQVAGFARKEDASVHMPRLGAGSAGGEWGVVEELIEDEVVRSGVDVIVYDLPPKRQQLELFG